ncbi:LemA family protein [Metamycoplasma spumans]|uniref:LemA family protein n=1 Tax=Metamycoplasma spumans TaxID=92406 RepID=UPI00048154A2
MLFDSRTQQTSEGFNPNVDNTVTVPKPTGFEKFLFVMLFIITFGLFGIAYYKRKNLLFSQINDIQAASSSIQAAERRRHDTLQNQMDALIGYTGFERETQTKVAELRSKLASLKDEKDVTKYDAQLNAIQAGLSLQFEQYPNLKADRLYLQFNSEISMQQDEIYSMVRIYNNKVNRFNSSIYTFWTNCVAAKINAYNQPLFQASAEERKNVDTSILRGKY